MSTVLISSIDRSTTYPIYQSVSITNNQMFLTIDTSTWTEQMFYELPNIQFGIYIKVNGEYVKYLSENITVKTKVPESSTSPADAICYKIINIPNEFYLYIKPIFDNNAIEAHNALIENGIEDGTIWTIPTDTFNIEIGYNLGDYVPVTNTITAVPPISFKSDGTPLTEWSITGNMVQDSTPTPSDPVQPSETGDLYNLYKDDNVITIAGLGDRYGVYLPNGTYTIRNDTGNIVYKCWGNMQSCAGCCYEHETATVTLDQSQAGLQGFMMPLNSGSLGGVTIVEGTEIPDKYYPYGTVKLPITLGTTQNIYLSEPIRKIGDYADVASATGTSGVVTRRIKKLVFDGTDDSVTLNLVSEDRIVVQKSILAVNSLGLCTHLRNNAPGDEKFVISSNRIYISFKLSSVGGNTLDDVNAYFASQYAARTPVTIWYVLETPTTETFTAPILTPATGNNTLTVNTTLQPSEVSITGTITQI